MTVRLKLSNLVYNGPVCFKNFYKHHEFTLVESATDYLNELLSAEPCKVKYVKPITEGGTIALSGNHHGWLEFDTKEDYTTFVLRWS